MAGPLDLLTDMFREFSETQLPGDEGYINLAQSNHYTSTFLMGGRSPEEMITTTQKIRKTLYPSVEKVGQRFAGPGLKLSYANRQFGVKAQTQISFYISTIGWNELEEDFGELANYRPEALRVLFNDIIRGKHQNMYTDCAETFEQEKWAAADQSAMRTNYLAPMSIPYFITEETDGFPLQADGSAMTDVLGLSSTTYPKWDNGRYTYAALGGQDLAGNDLLGGLTAAAIGQHWEPLPIDPKYGVIESAPNVVFCSNDGLLAVQAALRSQDRWGRDELGNARGLMIGDMMIRNVSALNAALLFSNNAGGVATGLVDEHAKDSTGAVIANAWSGPRFWGMTKKKFKPVFMKGRYMSPDAPTSLTQVGQPIDFVQNFKTYNQLLCWDRSKQFILSPSQDIVGF